VKTYLTREQWEHLCEKLGGSVAGGLALDQLGIECRRSNHKDRLDFQDIRSMAAELGEPIALRFSAQDDVRHAYPWLSPDQANEVAAECADSFDYEYRLDVFESYMRYHDLPIDPPDGWFEWTNEHGDVEFTTWLKADAEAAATKGWALDGFMSDDPKIVPVNPKLAELALSWVKSVAATWPIDHQPSSRAAAKAMACINAAQPAGVHVTPEDGLQDLRAFHCRKTPDCFAPVTVDQLLGAEQASIGGDPFRVPVVGDEVFAQDLLPGNWRCARVLKIEDRRFTVAWFMQPGQVDRTPSDPLHPSEVAAVPLNRGQLAHEVGKGPAGDPLGQDPRYCAICRLPLDGLSLAPALDGQGWVHAQCAAERDLKT